MSRQVSHPNPLCPGHYLRARMSERGLSQADVARLLNRPIKTISEICTGKAAITAETALQFEALFSVSAIVWLILEVEFRLDEAKKAGGHG